MLKSLLLRPAYGITLSATARAVPTNPGAYFSSSPVSATNPRRTCSSGERERFAFPPASIASKSSSPISILPAMSATGPETPRTSSNTGFPFLFAPLNDKSCEVPSLREIVTSCPGFTVRSSESKSVSPLRNTFGETCSIFSSWPAVALSARGPGFCLDICTTLPSPPSADSNGR